MDVDIEPENIEHKSVVLKKVLYDDLITECKQAYNRKKQYLKEVSQRDQN